MNGFFAPAALPLARRRLIDALELRFAATGALRHPAVTLHPFAYTGLAVKAHRSHLVGIGGAIERVEGGPCGGGSKRDKAGDDRGIRGILHCWGTCSSSHRTASAVFCFWYLCLCVAAIDLLVSTPLCLVGVLHRQNRQIPIQIAGA